MLCFVKMPTQLPSEMPPTLFAVCKRVGERVKAGDILLIYSYDGALFEERSCISGEVVAIFFEKNDAVSGGVPVMAIEEEQS